MIDLTAEARTLAANERLTDADLRRFVEQGSRAAALALEMRAAAMACAAPDAVAAGVEVLW